MRSKRWLRKGILLTCILSFIFYFLPFISLLFRHYRAHVFNEIAGKLLYDKVTQGCNSDSAKVMSLYHFFINNISTPPKNAHVKNLYYFDMIMEGIGYCDEQSNSLITLAGKGGIKGRLTFLYGYDTISHHSVCEILVNNKYRMFDPYYKTIFHTQSGDLARIADIQLGNIKYERCNNSLQHNYLRLFEEKYPCVIFRTNDPPVTLDLSRLFINSWLVLFGNLATRPYFYFYTTLSNFTPVQRKRLRKLLCVGPLHPLQYNFINGFGKNTSQSNSP